MVLRAFSDVPMKELKEREGETLFAKVVFKGEPLLVNGIIDSVSPFKSVSLDEYAVTKKGENLYCGEYLKIPFIWKGVAIQVVAEEILLEGEEQKFKNVIYENFWVLDNYNIKDTDAVYEFIKILFGAKVARNVFPELKKEQEKEERAINSWIKIKESG